MTTALQTTDRQDVAIMDTDVSAGALQEALAGNLVRMSVPERLKFYGKLCEFTGLNPLAKPFDWIEFKGQLKLYANAGCAEQLRKIHGVTIHIVERKCEDGVYIVRVKATDKTGRCDEAIGVVPLDSKTFGEIRANAMMKAETKAKRRVTFSICGLSLIADRDDEPQTARVTGISNVETTGDIAGQLNEVIASEVPKVAEPAKPEPVKPAIQEAEIVQPNNNLSGSHTETPAAVVMPPTPPAAAAVASQDAELEKLVMEVETVIGGNRDFIPFLIESKGVLKKGEPLSAMGKGKLLFIVRNAKSLEAQVAEWVAKKGGAK